MRQAHCNMILFVSILLYGANTKYQQEDCRNIHKFSCDTVALPTVKTVKITNYEDLQVYGKSCTAVLME